MHVDGSIHKILNRPLRDIFDAPDLAMTDDKIANGLFDDTSDGPQPLAPFTAPRIDYSLHRLAHYTATSASHFQNFVLFTNYQFYMDEFVRYAHMMLDDPDSGYTELVEPGNVISRRVANVEPEGIRPDRLPQMPAYHLKTPGPQGHYHDQYRRWTFQCQDDYRSCGGFASRYLADAGPLCRTCEIPSRWAIMCWPMPMCAKTVC